MAEVVRAVRDEELPVLRDIERASAQRYREFGLDQVADDEPASIEELADYVDGGRAWVAQDAHGAPVGYILVDTVDGPLTSSRSAWPRLTKAEDSDGR